jgi:hypothetical protein
MTSKVFLANPQNWLRLIVWKITNHSKKRYQFNCVATGEALANWIQEVQR